MTECPDRQFYSRPTAAVARDLVGMKLVRTLESGAANLRIAGIIVETEAYGHTNDGASHARIGATKRNSVMFGAVGRAYVYFAYGNHYCVNVSARSREVNAGAVLIRALEPVEGIEIMRKLRHNENVLSLASGPGKLTQALNITGSCNGVDMTDPDTDLHIEYGSTPRQIIATQRIGIARGTAKKWRFLDPTTSYVSKKAQIKVR
ncbi:MAG TPA: DNA-3-methyladenine glycosylase [Nitrososphaera sp.]|nr:DNA-3-methyladenine glycosylase [Nitrososphaera sp.]